MSLSLAPVPYLDLGEKDPVLEVHSLKILDLLLWLGQTRSDTVI